MSLKLKDVKPIKSVFILFVSCLWLWACHASEQKSNAEKTSTTPPEETSVAVTSFNQWQKNPTPIVSAHRGGPYPGYPENALQTFENIARQTPTIIESDIAMTKDSVLILMHDKTLDRTTTGTGLISETNYSNLQDLLLLDNDGDTTNFKIPTLEEALKWGENKVLFTLDVKRGVPFEKVIAMIERLNATTYAAIITYRIQDAQLVHSLDQNLIISVSVRDNAALEQIKKTDIPSENILGFVGTREPSKAHYQTLNEMGIKSILGTLGNLDKSAIAKGDDSIYLKYINNGANIIATDRPLEVAKVINTHF